ncbi:MAG: hypothetical protein KF845_04035 [Cyclobacteriaceae bacterium]|nr:hypothetical protein [Cyclobacteriaceae bacterium]
MKKTITGVLALAVIVVVVQSCAKHFFRSNYDTANSLLHETNNIQTKLFLKAHLKNGDIAILRDTWEIDTVSNTVSGTGVRYGFNRNPLFEGAIRIAIDSVALFETNKKIQPNESGRVAALSILTAVNVVGAIICLSVPKACFGSCPTFYINEDDNVHYADAEGFSNAIIPSMEYGDVDALNNHLVAGSTFSLTMKNEALETHCIRDVKLLAYPTKAGERVYQSPGNNFYRCENNYPLTHAVANEGDITSLLLKPDRTERFSLSDEHNLNSKEEIYLTFHRVENPNGLGLVLNFRQTLMTTYLFYSAMGYMGDQVSDVFYLLESNPDMRSRFDATTKALGGIDVYGWNETTSSWEYQNGFHETGPIAINRQLVPLTIMPSASKVKIKIVLNKGLWRIDYVALTNIREQIMPVELSPTEILINQQPNKEALQQLRSADKLLISMPGNAYKINFTMPVADADYELFLYTKGYYLEWMRAQWIKDKNFDALKKMVFNPGEFLKEEALDYKHYETTMEQQFWSSKIDTNTFSY